MLPRSTELWHGPQNLEHAYGPFVVVCFWHAKTHGGPRFIDLPEGRLAESAQTLIPEKSQGGRKAWHRMVAHACGDPTRSC